MAEIFGVVASGIGIAGVAAQAIDGIQKLQIFCKDIRDAPEEIKYMANELEILLRTIANIEAQIQRNASTCQNLNPLAALHSIHQSVNSLNDVIQKLNLEIAHKRKLGSIKTAWKKKVLEAHFERIEKSKTSLGLAVMIYSTELFLQANMRSDRKIDQLSTDVATSSTSSQAQLMSVLQSQISDKQQIGCSQQLLAVDDHDWSKVRKRSKSSRLVPVLSFALRLPRWLAQSSLQISVCRSSQNWKLTLKPYRSVPYNSELGLAIKYGDFDKFLYLFDSKQVTVFDRDERGHTILHDITLFASHENLEVYLRMARFLIERGADVNEPSYNGTLAIYMLSIFDPCVSWVSSGNLWNMGFLRLLVNEMELDADFFWENFRRNVNFTTSPRIEPELKEIFPLTSMGYPTFTMAEKLEYIIRTGQSCNSPQDLAVYLDIESLETTYSRLNESLRSDLLRVIIMQWGFDSASATPREEWWKILRALIAAGAKLDILCSQGTGEYSGRSNIRNPGDEVVVELIHNFVEPYVSVSTAGQIQACDTLKGVRYLISRTEYIGVKLETFSSHRRYKLGFDESSMCPLKAYLVDASFVNPHTLSLYYDNGSSTWEVWNSTYEEYHGEFWDLLDHPERTMPGAWVEQTDIPGYASKRFAYTDLCRESYSN